MKLTKEQINQIQSALLGGYDEESLRMMVRLELNEDLTSIAGGDARTLKVRVFSLIEWAEKSGRIFDLIDGAYAQQPNNNGIQQLWQDSQKWRAPARTLSSQKGARQNSSGMVAGLISLLLVLSILVFVPELNRARSDADNYRSDYFRSEERASALATEVAVQQSLAEARLDVIHQLQGTVDTSEVVNALGDVATSEPTATLTTGVLVPTPMATPSPTVLPAADATVTNPIDGAVYVYVPAGSFIMGSSDQDSSAADSEKPQQPDFYLGAFWIMRNEVTNAQYAKCVEAGVCREPANGRWNDPMYAEHPVTHVDWEQANAYAQWTGGRLPTEAEWEKACRGIDGRIYPWGDDQPTRDLANYDNNVGDTTLVGSYPDGVSPYGALDMAGNVWEWTSSLYQPYSYDASDGREDAEAAGPRTSRGGAWNINDSYVRCAGRFYGEPGYRNIIVGFRVVSPGS